MKILEEIELPTGFGIFDMIAVDSGIHDFPHLILKTKNIHSVSDPYVRIHSECMTGDVFSSQRCDCGEQLDYSMERIARNGGVLIYLRQEGRGIGLINKMKAYNLQDQGLDTYEANTQLGLHQDSRDFSIAIEMLEHLNLLSIKLLTNNPEKVGVFDGSPINVLERVPIEITSNDVNRKYLQAKKSRAGHFLSQFGDENF